MIRSSDLLVFPGKTNFSGRFSVRFLINSSHHLNFLSLQRFTFQQHHKKRQNHITMIIFESFIRLLFLHSALSYSLLLRQIYCLAGKIICSRYERLEMIVVKRSSNSSVIELNESKEYIMRIIVIRYSE